MSLTFPIFTVIINWGTTPSRQYIQPISRALNVTVKDTNDNIITIYDEHTGEALPVPYIVSASAKGRFKFRAPANVEYVVEALEPIANLLITVYKNASYGGHTFSESTKRTSNYTLDKNDNDIQVETQGNVVVTIPLQSVDDLSLDNNRVFTHTITHNGGGVVSFVIGSGGVITTADGYDPLLTLAGQSCTLVKSNTDDNKWFLSGQLNVDGTSSYWSTIAGSGGGGGGSFDPSGLQGQIDDLNNTVNDLNNDVTNLTNQVAALTPPPTIPPADDELLVVATYATPSLNTFTTSASLLFNQKYCYDLIDTQSFAGLSCDWNDTIDMIAAAGSTTNYLKAFDTSTTPWTVIPELVNTSDVGNTAVFSGNGQYLAFGTQTTFNNLLYYPTDLNRSPSFISTDNITNFTFNRTATKLYGCESSQQGSMYVYNIDVNGDITTDPNPFVFNGNSNQNVFSIDCNKAYDILAVLSVQDGFTKNAIDLYHSTTGAYIGSVTTGFVTSSHQLKTIKWSNDGLMLAVTTDSKIFMWSFTNPNNPASNIFTIFNTTISNMSNGLAFSKNGRWLAVTSYSGEQYYVFDLSTKTSTPSRVYQVPAFSSLAAPGLAACFVGSGSFGIDTPIDTTPPPSDDTYSSDLFWMHAADDLSNPLYWVDYLDGNKWWEHSTDSSTTHYDLVPTDNGIHLGWQNGFRPTLMRVTVNSGQDLGNFGFLAGNAMILRDTGGNIIGSTSFVFDSYEQDLVVDVVIDAWDSFDIGRLIMVTYLYNDFTIKFIDFD